MFQKNQTVHLRASTWGFREPGEGGKKTNEHGGENLKEQKSEETY